MNRAADLRDAGDRKLVNRETPFNIVGAQVSWRTWTAAAEDGWGTTAVVTRRGRRTSDLMARYLLLSRQIGKFRAGARADEFAAGTNPHRRAFTGALFGSIQPRLRTGIEGITEGGQHRVALELRYRI